jgi:hypothetical protein
MGTMFETGRKAIRIHPRLRLRAHILLLRKTVRVMLLKRISAPIRTGQ